MESKGQVVVQDRLGSTVVHGAERLGYWPYGEEKPGATAQNRPKFGTYFRDQDGKDYARQRYYASSTGRFLTPDPYMAPGVVTTPQAWNRYVYVVNDPINYIDPGGLDYTLADALMFNPADPRNVNLASRSMTVYADPNVEVGIDDPPVYFSLLLSRIDMPRPIPLPHPPQSLPAPPPLCGVNPITGSPGVVPWPTGELGQLRPGEGGGGMFDKRRERRRRHGGLDIAAPLGANVYASLGGTVTFAGWQTGYGNTVVITVGGGITLLFAHLQEITVSVGQVVGMGDVLGTVGQSGNARGQPASEDYLHFEVRSDGVPVNPRDFLNSPCPGYTP